jgi:heme exporter protein C
MSQRTTKIHLFGITGLLLLLVGSFMGLFLAPSERYMGDVQRIMYVHLPSAWNGMLCYTFAFGFALASLWQHKPKWDALTVGAIEVGALLNALLLVQGSIWARPTWGVWWDWDVRLTTSLIMLLLFAGVLALRSFVEDPTRRATWTAITTIVAFIDVPLVYFCVRWWRSLHQVQSTPETVSAGMVWPLRINSIALLFLVIWMVAQRARLELIRHRNEQVDEPAKMAPVGGLENV